MALGAKWAPQPFVSPFRRVIDAASTYRRHGGHGEVSVPLREIPDEVWASSRVAPERDTLVTVRCVL